MLKVHHLGISQSERIIWLCEELTVPYELVRYERDPATRMAPPEYKALNLLGMAPIIQDGTLTLGESAAIIEYISRRYAGSRLILGPEHKDFTDYLFWFHFANGSMMPAIMMDLTALRLGAAPAKLGPAAADSRSNRGYNAIEQRLGRAQFFAGDEFTAADIMMLFPLTTMRYFAARDLSPYPNIRAYLQRIGERPAYRRAMAKGDPNLPLQLT
jgi:glutathione S-transferase